MENPWAVYHDNLQKNSEFEKKSKYLSQNPVFKKKVYNNNNYANYVSSKDTLFKSYRPSKFKFAKKVAKFQYLEVGLNVDLAWHRKNKAFAGGMPEDSGSNY